MRTTGRSRTCPICAALAPDLVEVVPYACYLTRAMRSYSCSMSHTGNGVPRLVVVAFALCAVSGAQTQASAAPPDQPAPPTIPLPSSISVLPLPDLPLPASIRRSPCRPTYRPSNCRATFLRSSYPPRFPRPAARRHSNRTPLIALEAGGLTKSIRPARNRAAADGASWQQSRREVGVPPLHDRSG